MKNNILTKTFCFLENHIALILGLFFPAWLGIFYVLGVVLNLLPEEIARKVEPQPMDIMFVILGALFICAIIAICRIVRDVRERKLKQILILLFLIAMDIVFLLYFINWFGDVQLKSDNALTTENLVRVVSIRLEAYKEEHGTYPPQQDMKSLLETLGIKKSDLRPTFFFDLYSAEYHAPAEDSNDPEDRLITMHVKWHLYESYDDRLLFLRREGTVGTEYLKDKTPPPVPKHEKERTIPEPDDERQ